MEFGSPGHPGLGPGSLSCAGESVSGMMSFTQAVVRGFPSALGFGCGLESWHRRNHGREGSRHGRDHGTGRTGAALQGLSLLPLVREGLEGHGRRAPGGAAASWASRTFWSTSCPEAGGRFLRGSQSSHVSEPWEQSSEAQPRPHPLLPHPRNPHSSTKTP